MQARLCRPATGPNPEYSIAACIEALKAQKPYRIPHSIDIPAGTVIDNPDAWKLVRMGMADPADEECRLAAAMTPEELEKAQVAQDRISRGMGYGDEPPPVSVEEIIAGGQDDDWEDWDDGFDDGSSDIVFGA